MKHIILFLAFFSFSFSASLPLYFPCTLPADHEYYNDIDYFSYSNPRTSATDVELADNSDTWGTEGLLDPPSYPLYCDETDNPFVYYFATHSDSVDSYGNPTTNVKVYGVKVNHRALTIVCTGDEVLDNTQIPSVCSVPPLPICTEPNQEYNITSESCECVTGFGSEYEFETLVGCIEPICPAIYSSLPLIAVAETVTGCNFFSYGDNYILDRPDGKLCCYGQSSDSEEPLCADNSIEINGECYPITPVDSNDSETPAPDLSCPNGEYYSFATNSCLPFYPDENATDSNGNPIPDSGSGDAPLPSEEEQQDFNDLLSGVGDNMTNALNSYVLVPLPITLGSCSPASLSQSFSMMGQTFTFDISSPYGVLTDNSDMFSDILLFIFGLTAVILVMKVG